ncbi:MAG: LacI family DNA-binding transcriptional regulator [Phycisphaeraceae bacterium JB051]
MTTTPTRPSSQPRKRADISVTDIANKANVSLGTVSRVMNQVPGVTEEMQRRVLHASRQLGFIPRLERPAIAILTGRHSPAMPVGYVSCMTTLLWRKLADMGYAVEIIDDNHHQAVLQSHARGVIGVVFDQGMTDLLQIPNLPLLSINNPMTAHGIHSVYADHHAQAVLAAEHLLANGHTNIGLLVIQRDEWGAAQRIAGFKQAMQNAGITVDRLFIAATNEQPVYDTLNRWHRNGITALLNFSEDCALEVIHILSNVLKLKIGKDVSTISLEDLPIYQYLSPPQTTIKQPLDELAQLAVEHITKHCDTDVKTNGITDITLPSQLIQRDSVANRR